MAIKVIATDMGHYGHLRQPGDEFEIKDEKAFSKKWMEKVGEELPDKPAPKKAQQGKQASHDVI